ncbi:GTP 3',8-cyclase MoaA [Glycomyces xiaoerkulensis]|uniref:GTP 3',8-cyclase MoaA n=1 Tax=Glycomyces xiaoerkulensis TaxID=2038139 RepID=UPI000C2573C5|nr:GTP 3',8-cyclase MoaA [Glycomyces xiaoerkulensis]
MSSPRLRDRHGRVATDLRVSLTDRCNLRCTYCMPEAGLPWLPKPTMLTDDEVIRLVGIAVTRLGVTEVRFTGGEPLLRPGLRSIIDAVTDLEPRPEVSLTTNAIGLERLAVPLVEAGLDRVNVSLDTIDRDSFKELAKRDRLDQTLNGIKAASAAGLAPVKLNTVLMRGINDDEAPALLRYALAHDYQLRFIEQMPLDAGGTWRRDQMVTAAEILEALRAEFDLTPDPAHRGSAPAETWLVDGGPAKVGVIGSVTRPFCGDCDRTRLTADGQVRNCLFATGETDLRDLARSGAGDEEIAARWCEAMWGKKPGHGIDDPSFLQPSRPMSAIGG